MNPFMLIQAAAQGAATEVEGEEVVEQSINLIELMLKGGWIMLPLGILSIIAVYIFIERYLALRRASTEDTTFMNRIYFTVVNVILDAVHKGGILYRGYHLYEPHQGLHSRR